MPKLPSRPRRLRARLCAIAFSAGALTGCASLTNIFAPTETIDVDKVACEAFKTITWSVNDTDATLEQIHEHNAAWERICEGRES